MNSVNMTPALSLQPSSLETSPPSFRLVPWELGETLQGPGTHRALRCEETQCLVPARITSVKSVSGFRADFCDYVAVVGFGFSVKECHVYKRCHVGNSARGYQKFPGTEDSSSKALLTYP